MLRLAGDWGQPWQVHVFCSNGNPETPFAPENYGATVTRGPGVEIQPKHKITLPSPHFLVPWSADVKSWGTQQPVANLGHAGQSTSSLKWGYNQ